MNNGPAKNRLHDLLGGEMSTNEFGSPTPIIANLCADTYRENRYDYVLEYLSSKLNKTYRSEKIVRL